MPEFISTRRSIIRTAAWSVPAVSVAAATPAFARSTTPAVTYQSVTKTFLFHPTFMGEPLTAIDIKVEVVANIPLVIPAGMTADPTTTVSTVTIPASLLSILQSALGNPAEVAGTSTSISKLTGALGNVDSQTDLTIDRSAFPTTAVDLVTVARGTGATSLTAPAGASGSVLVTLAPPNSTLVGYDASGAQSGTYPSVLAAKSGQDYTLGTITIS